MILNYSVQQVRMVLNFSVEQIWNWTVLVSSYDPELFWWAAMILNCSVEQLLTWTVQLSKYCMYDPDLLSRFDPESGRNAFDEPDQPVFRQETRQHNHMYYTVKQNFRLLYFPRCFPSIPSLNLHREIFHSWSSFYRKMAFFSCNEGSKLPSSCGIF